MPPKEKKQRQKKDPNAPKRALSAYMFFANDQRDQVRSDNPGISFGQIGKLLGEKWKSMEADDREKYEKLAENDKKRYEEAKIKYLEKKESEFIENAQTTD